MKGPVKSYVSYVGPFKGLYKAVKGGERVVVEAGWSGFPHDRDATELLAVVAYNLPLDRCTVAGKRMVFDGF